MEEDVWMKAYGSQPSLLISSIIGILLSIVSLVEQDWAVYLALITQVVYLTAFYGAAFGFIPSV